MAWKRAVEKLIAERILQREDGVLAMADLVVALFVRTPLGSPSTEKRMVALQTLLRTAWQAGGRIRRDSVPWVSREAMCNPESELHAARTKAVDDLEAAGDIEPDGDGFRILTIGLCPEEQAPTE
jgi:hypothetical protein